MSWYDVPALRLTAVRRVAFSYGLSHGIMIDDTPFGVRSSVELTCRQVFGEVRLPVPVTAVYLSERGLNVLRVALEERP